MNRVGDMRGGADEAGTGAGLVAAGAADAADGQPRPAVVREPREAVAAPALAER